MQDMGIAFERMSASRYAGGLRDATRRDEPQKLLDLLLIGALIEARSCERFACIAPRLPEQLKKFYVGLLASEARHFEHYLALARSECAATDDEIDARLAELMAVEAALISESDTEFGFHSGPPLQALVANNILSEASARQGLQARSIFVPSNDTSLLVPVAKHDPGGDTIAQIDIMHGRTMRVPMQQSVRIVFAKQCTARLPD